MHVEHTIELDCAPFGPRPGDYFPGVIEGTSLVTKEPENKCFGNWTWNYNEVSCEAWEKVRPLLKERITKLYKSGSIRSGSW